MVARGRNSDFADEYDSQQLHSTPFGGGGAVVVPGRLLAGCFLITFPFESQGRLPMLRNNSPELRASHLLRQAGI